MVTEIACIVGCYFVFVTIYINYDLIRIYFSYFTVIWQMILYKIIH